MKTQLLTIAIVLTFHPGYGQNEESTTGSLTKDERIAAHRQNVAQIMTAHRMIEMYVGEATSSRTLPRVVLPAVFESTIFPALRHARIETEQQRLLRNINSELWKLSHEKETTSPEVGFRVQELLSAQANVLTQQQQESVWKAYQSLQSENQRRTRHTPVPGQKKSQ